MEDEIRKAVLEELMEILKEIPEYEIEFIDMEESEYENKYFQITKKTYLKEDIHSLIEGLI